MLDQRPPATGATRGAVRRRERAFSMIEMLGVLMVMMIMTLALVPAVIKEADRLARDAEDTTLNRIATALKSKAVTDHVISGTNTFLADMANELGWRVSDVQTNARGNPRVYIVDPALRLGTNAGQTLPFVQTVYGSIDPVSPRAIIASSIGQPLPSVFTNAGGSAQTVFNMLWGASDNTTPSGWTYGGDFNDIRIQRVNFDPLFVQVILNNNSTDTGKISVDDGTAITLPSKPYTNSYLLGTVLGLHGSDSTLQIRQVLQDALTITNSAASLVSPCFVYENGIWRGRLLMTTAAQRAYGTELRGAYNVYMAATANPGAKPSGTPVTQGQVTTDMYLFMSNYVYWANNSFSTGTKGGVSSSQTTLAGDTKNYVGK